MGLFLCPVCNNDILDNPERNKKDIEKYIDHLILSNNTAWTRLIKVESAVFALFDNLPELTRDIVEIKTELLENLYTTVKQEGIETANKYTTNNLLKQSVLSAAFKLFRTTGPDIKDKLNNLYKHCVEANKRLYNGKDFDLPPENWGREINRAI